MEGPCQLLSVVHNGIDIVLGNVLGRIYGDTVAGVDTGTLNMLHDTGNQDVGAVTDGIHLDFLAHDILVNQNRMLLGYLVDNADELYEARMLSKLLFDDIESRVKQFINCLGKTSKNYREWLIEDYKQKLSLAIGKKYREKSVF